MASFSPRVQQQLLKEVSRSFYLSLRVLPQDVRPVISLGYLLCRAADTIADDPAIPIDEKKLWLQKFKSFFSSFPIPEDKFKELLKENKIISRFEGCADWFNSLERTDQSLLQSVVTAVINGMEIDLAAFGEADGTSARSFLKENELESYIHWIGGEPGRFWTNACLAHLPNLGISNREHFLQDGIVFGTGLQMVNILRDLPADLKMGRCYLPLELLQKHDLTVENLLAKEKEDVFLTIYVDLIDQTLFRLGRGLSYLRQLPRTALGLRAAVAWPMLIGAMTLKRLRETPSILRSTEPVKITRKEIYRLILRSAYKLPWNFWLKREFEKLS